MDEKIETYGEAPLEVMIDCGTHVAFYALQNFVRKEIKQDEQELAEPDEHGIIEQATQDDIGEDAERLREKYTGKPLEYNDVVKETKQPGGRVDMKKASKVWKVLKGNKG